MSSQSSNRRIFGELEGIARCVARVLCLSDTREAEFRTVGTHVMNDPPLSLKVRLFIDFLMEHRGTTFEPATDFGAGSSDCRFEN